MKIEDKIKNSRVVKLFGQRFFTPCYGNLCGKSTKGASNGYTICMKKFDSAESGHGDVRQCTSRYEQSTGQPVIAKGLAAYHGVHCVRIDNQGSPFRDHSQRRYRFQGLGIISFYLTFSPACRLIPWWIECIFLATELHLVAFMGGKDAVEGLKGSIISGAVIQVVDEVELS